MEFLNSIKKLENIFNSMTELIAIQDTENNIIWVNDIAAKSTGFTKDKLKGMKCYHVWNNRKAPCKNCPVGEAIKTGGLKTSKISTEKGKHFFITGFPLKNSKGEVEGAIELTTEITEEVKSKDALKKSEKNFHSLFNNSIDGIYITTPEGEYIDANPALVKMLGYKNKEELMAIDIINDLYVSKNDRPKSNQRNRIFKTSLRKKDGTIIQVEISSKVIYENGKPKYYQGIVRDITSREKAENNLKKITAEYEKVFNGTQDAMFLVSISGENNFRYIRNNIAHQKLTGFPLKTIRDKSPTELVGEKTGKKIAANYKRCIKSASPISYEEELDLPGGKRVWSTTLTPVFHNGKPVYIVGSSQDITERKKAENKLRYLSFHDSLTGLYNKAYFEEELKRLDTERQLPVSIIVSDLNNLKLVNDTFGHLEGDKFLKKVALLLKKFSRKEDIVARWGGDEFCIILPKTSKNSAEKKVKKIIKECGKNNARIPVSISFGVATKESMSQNLKEIFQDAEDNMYKSKLLDKKSSFNAILETLMKALHEKSMETEKHSRRLKNYAVKLGKALNLSENQLKDLSLLASLHDIGKVAISEKILKKKSKLTKKEFKIIQKHSEAGYNIVQSIPQLSHIADAILYHHERWDGQGYPQGIKGPKIPLLSRILAIVDSYDIMRQERTYKTAKSKKESIDDLKNNSGTKFDPDLVEKFISILDNL